MFSDPKFPLPLLLVQDQTRRQETRIPAPAALWLLESAFSCVWKWGDSTTSLRAQVGTSGVHRHAASLSSGRCRGGVEALDREQLCARSMRLPFEGA